MKFLLAILTVIVFTSCKNDTETQTLDNTDYQLRLQIVGQNGDTTYSETKVVR